jgi:hypothetical protein
MNVVECSGVASSISGGTYSYIRIQFTDRKNNQFQKKLIMQNTNIWICPPPTYRAGYATGWMLIFVRRYTGCIKKRRPLEIKHIVKIWMPFHLHICWTVVREILMSAYIRKRRPLEINHCYNLNPWSTLLSPRVRNMRSTYSMHGRLFPGADNLVFKRFSNICTPSIFHALRFSICMYNWKGIQILTIWLISKGLLFFYTPCITKHLMSVPSRNS